MLCRPLSALGLLSVLTISSLAAADEPPAPAASSAAADVTPLAPLPADAAPATPEASVAATPDAPAPGAPPAQGEPTQTDAAPASPLALFRQEYIQYDSRTGEATRGQAKTTVTREELYRMLGRQDLLEAADAQRTTRNVLFAVAGATVAAGLVVGFEIRKGIPNLNSVECSGPVGDRSEKSCVDGYRSHELWSAVAMVGGLLLGGGIATVAGALTVDGAPRTTIAGMVASYNGSIMRRLREPGALPATATGRGGHIVVTPSVGLNGGGLAARLSF